MIYFDFMQKLEQIMKLKAIIENKKSERAELMTLLTGLVVNMDGMPHGSATADKIGRGVERLEKYDEDIKERINEYLKTVAEVTSILEQLTTEQYKVLYSQYVKGMDVYDIAEEMGVSRSTVFLTRKTALDTLKLLCA